ncbi:MAG: DUF169 domain-containing protein [Promethearchaeota archaeon]
MVNNKYTIKDYQKTGQKFYDKLRLLTFPVAIKYFKDESEIPNKIGIIRPSKINQRITLCQAYTITRRWGRDVVMTFEDNHCITSSFVNEWAPMPSKEILKSQIISKYHKNARAELNIQLEFAKNFKKEDREKIKGNIGFISSPLNKTCVIPDVILCYGNPAQITHIIHALTYEGRNLITDQAFMGYGESCLLGVLTTFLKNKPQIVLPGEGDRTYGMTTENEMAIGLPPDKLFYIMKNLFKSADKFNFGMPSKFMILDTPFPMGPPAFRFLNRQYKRLQKGRLKRTNNKKKSY